MGHGGARTTGRAAGAQLVDVLPEQEYADEHLPGAINIALKPWSGPGSHTRSDGTNDIDTPRAQLMRRYRHTHRGMKIASRPMIQAAAPASDPGTPPSSA